MGSLPGGQKCRAGDWPRGAGQALWMNNSVASFMFRPGGASRAELRDFRRWKAANKLGDDRLRHRHRLPTAVRISNRLGVPLGEPQVTEQSGAANTVPGAVRRTTLTQSLGTGTPSAPERQSWALTDGTASSASVHRTGSNFALNADQ